jgi:hypothetical protein
MEPKSEFKRRLFEMGSITLVPRCPNYFWYATFGFELPTDDLPPYAGWLRVRWHERYKQYVVEVEREAPRIHRDKMRESNIHKVNRWLAYKLKNMYLAQYPKDKEDTGAPNGTS